MMLDGNNAAVARARNGTCDSETIHTLPYVQTVNNLIINNDNIVQLNMQKLSDTL